MSDLSHMHHALVLAARALGRVAPNPAVGCVIVDAKGRIVGRGHTQKGGRPHAETVALAQAGAAAKGATAYVTLEPCSHLGKTPPCADALIEAGIALVVVGAQDPDPRVNGAGIARLRASGVGVKTGILEDACKEMNAGFFSRILEKRPLVTLKIAQSLDGRTASASGESKWITGEPARQFGHMLRAEHDAILVGIGTAQADDPELTCRLPGLEDRSPLRVILDSRLKLSEWSKLAQSAHDHPTVVFTVNPDGGAALRAAGVEIIVVAKDARGRADLNAILKELAARGITRLLVEGGATIHATFLDRGFADRLEVFTAGLVLGAAGHASIDSLAALALDEASHFARTAMLRLGDDLLESYRRKA